MLYLYDEAICEDLQASFNRDEVENPVVKVIAPDGMIGAIAQIKEGTMTYPMVGFTRGNSVDIDTSRFNFSSAQFGVETVIDNETNLIYYEKCLPVNLTYTATVLTTNTADMDEMLRELMFKYINMYFLTLKIPYESKRKIRFGVSIDTSSTIEYSSGSFEYISTGVLYQSVLHLVCDGCVMISYTPAKLKRLARPVMIPRLPHNVIVKGTTKEEPIVLPETYYNQTL